MREIKEGKREKNKNMGDIKCQVGRDEKNTFQKKNQDRSKGKQIIRRNYYM